MRHVLRPPLAPGSLAVGMAVGTPAATLVTVAGPAQRLPAPLAGTFTRAVDLPPIAAPADPHLLRAALAVEQPEVLAHRAPTRVWTTPWARGIKAQRPRRYG